MIKEGVVKKDKTPCPVTGRLCYCSQTENECELPANKSASVKDIGALISEEEYNKEDK